MLDFIAYGFIIIACFVIFISTMFFTANVLSTYFYRKQKKKLQKKIEQDWMCLWNRLKEMNKPDTKTYTINDLSNDEKMDIENNLNEIKKILGENNDRKTGK